MKPITINLLNWYQENKRPLPWRQNPEAYRIWLSEIILQQTRVSQGLPYYLKFIEAYPTVDDLANAPEDDVLKLWQGLGYYSRARNLRAAAIQVQTDFNSVFPNNYKDLLTLKGVGSYTAAAIASIAHNEAVAVVDGNVQRVMARLFNIIEAVNSKAGHQKVQQAMDALIATDVPGDFNQSVMELGALVCTPKNPSCDNCPVQLNCKAFETNTQLSLPFKEKKTKVKEVFYYYMVFKTDQRILLNKRTQKGIWQNLHDFPLIESDKRLPLEEAISKAQTIQQGNVIHTSEVFTHILSHRKIQAQFLVIETASLPAIESESHFEIAVSDLSSFAIPRLVEKFLETYTFE